jgi:hypothetical protein
MPFLGLRAGPGPSTLLFRRTVCAHRHSSTKFATKKPRQVDSPSPRASWRQDAIVNVDDILPPAPRMSTKIHNSTTFEARKPGRSQSDTFSSKVDPVQTISLLPDTDEIIQLRSPPVVDSTLPARLRKACHRLDIRKSIDLYKALYEHSQPSEVDHADMEAVAHLLSTTMTGSEGHFIRRTAVEEPEVFGWLSEMAVMAAAHDKWDGLYYLMLATLAAGRPSDVVNMHTRYKAVLRVLQGKKLEDLVSWVRKDRLASRLTAEGLTPLGAINVAAHTQLGTFQATAILEMLDSDFDAANVSWSVQDDIKDILFRLAGRAEGLGPAMFRKYLDGMEDITFAVLCYHPNAFADRIIGYARAQHWEQVDEIWRRLLRCSKGEFAFVRARPLDEIHGVGRVYHEIPITSVIWGEQSRNNLVCAAYEW